MFYRWLSYRRVSCIQLEDILHEDIPQQDILCIMVRWAYLKVFQEAFSAQMLPVRKFCDSFTYELLQGSSPAEKKDQDLRSL